jgi:hypothetical protein
MKIMNSIFFLTVVFASNAHATLPQNDPVVQKLRDEFYSAHAPSVDELKFGKEWNCTDFDATSASSSIDAEPRRFSFHSMNGLIINPTQWFPQTLAYTQYATLAGIGGGSTFHFRVNTAGDLLVEWDITYRMIPPGVTVAPSQVVTAPDTYVNKYAVCPVTSVSNPLPPPPPPNPGLTPIQ